MEHTRAFYFQAEMVRYFADEMFLSLAKHGVVRGVIHIMNPRPAERVVACQARPTQLMILSHFGTKNIKEVDPGLYSSEHRRVYEPRDSLNGYQRQSGSN